MFTNLLDCRIVLL